MATHAIPTETYRNMRLQRLVRHVFEWLARAPLATRRLARREVILIPALRSWSTLVGRDGVVLRCDAGTIWITREGDLEDHVLSAPCSFTSSRRGRLGVMAFTSARFLVEGAPPAASRPCRGAGNA